ncbi:carbohydrate ABC transporter substrate-binding protein [Tuanshanicoccus lijuaniae]|uniref:carbohydrate ABC transporter substrate-binding protein n=1 Tax=Aerococcaceae bacterium zg-1292 TaxID=2774330 RepID=UPI001BD8FCA5|nr:carbohydrate ABC transporter substrate-binding protein [Aerococcaceae bacterium zg-A91]MBS4457358.1 carbohydrate ABC transporter substrate-binding protein [Aerococcaceae bacterium zg-BR33]
MKKVLLTAAATLMAATVFAGVPVSAEEKVKLDLAAVETAYGTELWKEIIEAYKEVNPNVEVSLSQEKELEDALTPRLQSGDYPDVVMLALSREKGLPETLIKDHALADLTDVKDLKIPGEDGTVADKLLPGFTDSTSTNPYNDGKTYLMPMFYSPTGLFYNKGLFKEKGWEVPKTWDEMWSLADKAKKEGMSLFTYPTASYLDTFFSSVILSSGGLDFYNSAMNYDPEVWKGEGLTEVFKTLGKLAENTEPTTVANANSDGYTRNQQMVLDNQALFMPNGTWVVGEMKDAPRAEGFEWGMMPIPTAKEGGDRYAYTFLEHIWVPEGAKQKEAAKEFIAFLYSDKAAEIFASHGAVQPIKGMNEKLSEEQQVFYNIYSDGVLPGMGGFVATEAIEGVNLGETLYEAFNSVVSGDLSVEDWQANVVEMMGKFHEKVTAQ